jgi:hypothetical protein
MSGNPELRAGQRRFLLTGRTWSSQRASSCLLQAEETEHKEEEKDRTKSEN